MESVLDEEVTYVTFPAWDGQKGVMTGTSPFLFKLGLGSMRADFPTGGNRWYLLDGGFAQLQSGDGEQVLTLLTDRALPAESLSVTDSEQELTAALAEAPSGIDRTELDRRRNLARAKVSMSRAIRERGI